MLDLYDWKGNMELLNIVLLGISKELPVHDTRYELNRLIGTLLSNNLKEKEKLDILMHEYNIPVNSELREDVNYMCNLGEKKQLGDIYKKYKFNLCKAIKINRIMKTVKK